LREYLAVVAAFAADRFERLKRWLTFRRLLGTVALLILLISLPSLIGLGSGIDLAFLFGFDWGLAFEVSALIMALSVREHLVIAIRAVKSWISHNVVRRLRRAVRRAPRVQHRKPLSPPPPDDEPAYWLPVPA